MMAGSLEKVQVGALGQFHCGRRWASDLSRAFGARDGESLGGGCMAVDSFVGKGALP